MPSARAALHRAAAPLVARAQRGRIDGHTLARDAARLAGAAAAEPKEQPGRRGAGAAGPIEGLRREAARMIALARAARWTAIAIAAAAVVDPPVPWPTRTRPPVRVLATAATADVARVQSALERAGFAVNAPAPRPRSSLLPITFRQV